MVLLLEPSHYQQFPVSEKVMQFILGLANNIPGIQVYCAEFTDLQQLAGSGILVFKRHPAFAHYEGIAESPDYMFPQVSGYFGSFFAYWKKCEKYL
jgi:deoxyribodipyrimidine photo-lyase